MLTKDEYRWFPFMRDELTVKFYGGPLHGEYRKMPDLRREYYCADDSFLVVADYMCNIPPIPYSDQPVLHRIIRYKLSPDGLPFNAIIGAGRPPWFLWSYVFDGFLE